MSKRNIAFTQPPEPAFLKRMKEKIGYQEKDTVETKKKFVPFDRDGDDEYEREDEKPVVVILNPEDIGDTAVGEKESLEEGSALDKKIVFRKPVKQDADEKSSSFVSSSKRSKVKKAVGKLRENNSRRIQNSSLLSFEEEDT